MKEELARGLELVATRLQLLCLLTQRLVQQRLLLAQGPDP